MGNTKYVWEKMYAAIGTLCGDGSFASRLEDATISSLMRLNDDDLTGELGEDLAFILERTKENMSGGSLLRPLEEQERQALIEKMLRITLETGKS